MTAIFLKYNNGVSVSQSDLEALKAKAEQALLKRARYCLHRTHEDPVQEMIIAFCRDSAVPVHKHLDKCESFHVIEGAMDVCFYNDQGTMTKKIELGDPQSGKPFFFRHDSGQWHTVIPKTRFVIVHETTKGPFKSDETQIMTPPDLP